MSFIVATGTSIPEFVATNEHVISLALEHSARTYEGNIDELEASIRLFLSNAGSRQRHWRSGLSKPIEHISDAWESCITKLDSDGLSRIGVLIYCGIDRGVMEPSHASLLANKFGLNSVRTFDVSDACMGWATAVQVAPRFVTTSRPYCAIVSAEFPIEKPGKVYPASFTIRNADDLMWKGAALTLGEAASVTIINALATAPGTFKSNAKHADACCVPLLRPDRFVDSDRLLPRLLDDCFVANMPVMAAAAYRDAQEVLITYIRDQGMPDIVLPHTVSSTGPAQASKGILTAGTVQNCFEFFGNIATASIAVGYEYFGCAATDGAHIAAWISAAGMSHAVLRLS